MAVGGARLGVMLGVWLGVWLAVALGATVNVGGRGVGVGASVAVAPGVGLDVALGSSPTRGPTIRIKATIMNMATGARASMSNSRSPRFFNIEWGGLLQSARKHLPYGIPCPVSWELTLPVCSLRGIACASKLSCDKRSERHT